MKKLFLIGILFLTQHLILAQKNFLDQAYLETSSKADSLVTPNRIHLSITLNEADSKNKKSVEDLEKLMESTLKKLNINTEKDLTLSDISSNFKSYFLKGQNILKTKNYNLLVRDAVTAGKVLAGLESVGISNVRITKVEHSDREKVILELKAEAIKKTQQTAQKLAQTLGQRLGKAIHIADSYTYSESNDLAMVDVAYPTSKMMKMEEAPIPVDFEKIKFETEIFIKYILE